MKAFLAGTVLTVMLVIGVAASGCSGEDADGPGVSDEPAVVTVQARNTAYEPSSIRVRVGEPFELRLSNADQFDHDLQVEGLDVEVVRGGSGMHGEHGVDPDGHGPSGALLAVHAMAKETMSGVFIARAPGTYDFWCTLPGHKEQGMVGRITVEG